MIRMNPDPHANGYSLAPTHHVSAIFENRGDMEAVHCALREAGFPDEDIEVYANEEGSEKLDVKAKNHGMLARIRRALEIFFTDELEHLNQIDQVLHDGGMAVVTRVGKDEDKKRRACDVCRAFDAREITYWGSLAIERLWIRTAARRAAPLEATHS